MALGCVPLDSQDRMYTRPKIGGLYMFSFSNKVFSGSILVFGGIYLMGQWEKGKHEYLSRIVVMNYVTEVKHCHRGAKRMEPQCMINVGEN